MKVGCMRKIKRTDEEIHIVWGMEMRGDSKVEKTKVLGPQI
jgi:hypothetical protein